MILMACHQINMEKTLMYVKNKLRYVIIFMTVLLWIACAPLAPEQPDTQPEAVAPAGNVSAACQPFDDIAAAPQYVSAPPQSVDSTKTYFAGFKMEEGGEFVVQLYPDKAPITVNSFVFLACKGFFNGVTFHRVLEGFMAQGGDPTGTGMGGPGYEFVNENSDLTFDQAGVVAMANAGPNTNGSQFFITFGPTPHLNGGYTIFGQVTSGMDVVEGLAPRDPDQFPDYTGDVIQSVTISLQ
jgi:cyclophilin family peptidyl-prolyl cis-trans isomerase